MPDGRLLENRPLWPYWKENPFTAEFILSSDLVMDNLRQRLSKYVRRSMTYDSDAINAFLGILGKFEHGPQKIQHYWGLPIIPMAPSGMTQEDRMIELFHGEYYAPEYSLHKRFAASLTWNIYDYSNRKQRRDGFPSWTWAGWYEQSCFPTCASSHVFPEVKIGIEDLNGKVVNVEDFASSGGFSLSPMHITPYIHITARAAPVQIHKLMEDEIQGEHFSESFAKYYYKGKPKNSTTWTSFQQRNGSRAYVMSTFVSHEAFKMQGPFSAILIGIQNDYKHDEENILLLVRDGKNAAERVGGLDILSKLGPLVYQHAGFNAYRKTAVEDSGGKVTATKCFDIDQIEWEMKTIRLG
jgi:hypothetical protein